MRQATEGHGVDGNQNIDAEFALPKLLSNNMSVKDLASTHHPGITFWKMQDKTIQIWNPDFGVDDVKKEEKGENPTKTRSQQF